ncbi:MAG: hypothetical protein C5B59_08085 [Bacteroidetes bacterium]|nr:MAG: hypothetical protein C5B59_08085 [Bacteroidota bacterium]
MKIEIDTDFLSTAQCYAVSNLMYSLNRRQDGDAVKEIAQNKSGESLYNQNWYTQDQSKNPSKP